MKRLYLLVLTVFLLSGCAADVQEKVPRGQVYPSLPEKLPLSADGVPLLRVYVTAEETVREMDVETYLLGVVAGEMKNDWPMEALRAQAILARTFVMRFVSEKESRYEGADISTDISEAQAYAPDAINDAVRQAVAKSEGVVLVTPKGELPYTWFHAHSGGTTALAREALGWQEDEPSYTQVTQGLDSPDAPAEARFWEASFTEADFLAACRRAGVSADTLDSLHISEKGPSGRAVTLAVNDMDVNAARLRLELGSTVMRSTLLTELAVQDGKVFMAGLGYGHGVGMPQWGAYALAMDGWSGEEIALHYYKGLSLYQFWQRSP
ncbi:MAG: SpoIID/LytB domain-containing protein [Aristaeellaceae bacterium]